MSRERRKILVYFLILNLGIVLFTVLFSFFFNPKDIVNDPVKSKCIFQKFVGLYCPGCGGTRAVGFLLSFDFVNSFLSYPPLFVGIFLIFYMDILYTVSLKKNTLEILKNHKYYEFILIPVSMILLFAVRNILLLNGIDTLGDFLN